VIDTTTNLGGFIAWLVAIAMAAASLWLLVLVARWVFESRRNTTDPLKYVMGASCAGASVFTLVLVLV
jgi:hypothetical protein